MISAAQQKTKARGKSKRNFDHLETHLPMNSGLSKVQMRHEDGSVPTVMIRGQSFRAMGLQNQHIDAAERFSRDWEAAYSKLRCRGFEPGVDGGRSGGFDLATIEAQRRIEDAKKHLGDRDWTIVKAVVVHGASARAIERSSGRHGTALRNDIESAFANLAAFYSGLTRTRDKNWVAFEKYIHASELDHPEEAARIWAKAEKDGFRPRSVGKRKQELAKALADASPPGPERVATGAIKAAQDWAKLEKKRICEFSISAAKKKSRALTFYYVNEDGTGPGDRTITVSSPYLLEALDAQLLKAAFGVGWVERNRQS